MSSLPLANTYFYSQHPWPSPPCSDLSVSSPLSSLVSTEQDDHFEGESLLGQIQPADLPTNIGEIYKNGDDNLKGLIFLLFCPAKKTSPLMLTSPFSPESIEDETVEENHSSQLPYQETSKIFANNWPVISAFFDINLSQITTCEQYIKQEISEWKSQWRIATSLVKDKYAKDLPEAKNLILNFIKKYPKYHNKISRNNLKYESRYKNFYPYLVSKALRYGITRKEDAIGFILIKTNFNISFKTASNKYYENRELASTIKFSDKKDKVDLCIKKEKYHTLIQNHRNEIGQAKIKKQKILK